MLEHTAETVRAGEPVEYPWELFRVQHFPGRDHEEAAEELGKWAREHGIEIDFKMRKILTAKTSLDVIYVLLSRA